MRMQRLVSLVVGTALVLGTSMASAQQPAAAPPPPPPYGSPITLEQAKKVMVGAEAEAKKNNWNVVMVVLDSGGNLVMLQRMDGAQFGSIEVAKEKAYSAGREGSQPGPPLATLEAQIWARASPRRSSALIAWPSATSARPKRTASSTRPGSIGASPPEERITP